MGQGTDSCGGYEVEYDPYDDGLGCGMWTQRDGTTIHVEDMTLKHLKGARYVAARAAQRASFSSDSDVFADWVKLFDYESSKREKTTPKPTIKAPVTEVRGKMVVMICHCGEEYQARVADIKRGWGLSCSKRCASIRREYGRPPAKQKRGEK